MVQIKLPDGSVKEYPEGVRPREVAEGIGKRLADAAVAAVADGTVVDLDRPLEDGSQRPIELRLLTAEGPRGARRAAALDGAHHGAGHPAAVSRASGSPSGRPPPPASITTSTCPATHPLGGRLPGHRGRDGPDRQGGRAVRAVHPARPRRPPVLSRTSARRYKVEHIDDELHKYGILSFYRQGEFVDLCRGPHIPHAGKVGAFKLLSVAGAYWKGHTDQMMLQRVYGTAFFDKKDLDAYLAQIEEAKKRDHRRLGKELGLFTISPLVGSGLILWMPKGAIVRGVLESFLKDELIQPRLSAGLHAAHRQGRAVRDQRPLSLLQGLAVPPDPDARRRGDGAGRRPGERHARRHRPEGPARPRRGSPRRCPLLGPAGRRRVPALRHARLLVARPDRSGSSTSRSTA